MTITRVPLANEEAQQTLAGLDVVRFELIAAVMQQPEVPKERASKNAAERLVRAFLKGAGVTSDEASADWGQKRQQQAIEGMRELIRTAIIDRKKETRYELVAVTLPIEPVLVPSDAKNAYNASFVKYQPFVGWSKNINEKGGSRRRGRWGINKQQSVKKKTKSVINPSKGRKGTYKGKRKGCFVC